MEKDTLSKKLLSVILNEDLDVDLDKAAEEIGNKAIHTSGVLGVALVVATADNSSMAVLTKKGLMKHSDLFERLEKHITNFKEDHPEEFTTSSEDDEDKDSDDEKVNPKLKLMLAMVAKDKIDEDGTPSGDLMVKVFLEMKKLTDKGMSNDLAVVKALNKVLGSPLSKKEEKELSKWAKEKKDED